MTQALYAQMNKIKKKINETPSQKKKKLRCQRFKIYLAVTFAKLGRDREGFQRGNWILEFLRSTMVLLQTFTV
jgi:hypothetical protein